MPTAEHNLDGRSWRGLALLALACLSGAACATESADPSSGSARVTGSDSVNVTTGADALAASGFEALQGLAVGLIVNHTAQVGPVHLADAIGAAGNETDLAGHTVTVHCVAS